MSGQYKRVQLFGGALEAEYPRSFKDLSDVRQIPSNQECFGDGRGLDYLNVDITQRISEQDAATDNAAFQFHFADITEEDQFTFAQPVEASLPALPDGIPALMGFCLGKAGADGMATGMLLLLVRLKEKLTDIVVTVILPELDPSAHKIENGVERGPRFEQAYVTLRHFRETFKILDWSLFDAED